MNCLLFRAVAVHVQLKVFFVPEAFTAKLAAQVFNWFKVRMSFADVRSQAAKHHIRSSTFLAVIFTLRVLTLALGTVSFSFLFCVVAFVTPITFEWSH